MDHRLFAVLRITSGCVEGIRDFFTMLVRAMILAAMLVVPLQATAQDAPNGAKLYKKFCRGCHGKDGRGGGFTFMPHIHNLTKKGYIDLLPDEHLFAVVDYDGK